MRKRITQTVVLVLFAMVMTAPAVAAGSPKVQCTIGGVTALTGPVPKSTLDVRFDWYSPSGAPVEGLTWSGGAKRFPTPDGAASVQVTLHGPDILLSAACEP